MLQKWEQRFTEVEFPCLIMLNWMHSWGLHLGFKSEDLWPEQLPRTLLLQGDTQLKLVVWLGWDTDHTDIDLSVTEPDQTVVYYGNRRSHSGGCLTRDFTQGYGPEVYYSKQAPAGKYEAHAKYYSSHQAASKTGATSAVVWVVRNMGDWASEQIEFSTVRLDSCKQSQLVWEGNI